MRYAQLLVVVGATALVACRDKYDIKNYAENLAEATCKKAYDCCTSAEIEASGQGVGYGDDEDDCEDNFEGAFKDQQKRLEKSIDAGRLKYDANQLEKCLDAYAAKSCEELKSRLTEDAAECDTVFTAQVANGGVCASDEDCTSGRCELAVDQDGDEADEGICQAYAAVGATCNETTTCGPGSYCEGSACVAAKADGATCTSNGQCDTGGCNGFDSEAGTDGTCGPKGGEGTRCYLTKGCAAVDPHVFAALAVVLWLVRRRIRSRVAA